ncbi:hypothetical protein M3148_07320 [Georgenia satyanarayanai]|uniref:hypothetical protein n=1 Tax=Georgenia satyanarayanai TaxID=860221 RepID=UPI0020403D3C|nr:hypothetical protein [Georgenia satyanarayanai]MCM3660806.1 hypothetical protein [Georgenia satyanarayanai]
MDVWRITVAALRRWYIFLPLLALTAGAVQVVGAGVAPEYEVAGTALITPGSAPAPVPNPYGGEQQATAAVAIVLNSAEMRARAQAEGLLASYEVAGQSRSTIMTVTVRGAHFDKAAATADYVFGLAVEELEARQSGAGIPPAAQYGLDVLAAPSLLGVAYDGKLQVQAVTGLLGASAALVVAVLFDDIVGLVRRRRARRRPRAGAPSIAQGLPDWPEDTEPAAESRRDRDHAHA